MRPLILPILRRGKEWHVVTRSGRTQYASACYAKVAGVHEYLEQRQKIQRAEDRRFRQSLTSPPTL